MAKTPRLLTTTQTTPAGVVLHFSGNSTAIPSGYLACDGSEVSKTSFAALYAVIGDTYNTQMNPTTGANWATPASGNFRLPDYRGMFLRGVGAANGSDSTSLGDFQDQKTAKNGMAATPSTTVTASSTSTSTSTETSASPEIRIGTGGTGANAGYWNWNVANIGPYGSVSTRSLYGGGYQNFLWNDAHSHSITTTTTTTTTPSVTANTTALAGDNETRPKNKGVHYIIKF